MAAYLTTFPVCKLLITWNGIVIIEWRVAEVVECSSGGLIISDIMSVDRYWENHGNCQ
jgi:hypothetical protein